ncbi:MAG: phosphoribosylanthranilate isomerase, partial [Roseivirga sp.]
SIRGGNEIRPGYKDFDEMADILEALEIDDMA